ncbi:YceI family protein [Ktedonosporobacter rubrisoli]|uniref:YceI family protein n=1 Tax=Ktedonosporobacter rubrisoli TaxID=2509675 RepID=A0A4P6K1G6_KTERU|nr:YceI family protein [Ktedonosporobacter rubrisoli]QBD81306.1 YceI family protein [Ktedonosporobacter rubrisoli]
MAWEIDTKHSQATFAVKHMMFTTVRGRFKVLSGQLNIDEQNPANSWVDAQVDVASIDTNDENRDNHLRSADFFDAAKYPTINFKSTRVEHVGAEEYKVTGNLSMHGVTREAVFTARYARLGKDPWGQQRAGLSAITKINRKDWDLNWNQALEAGGVLVGEEVTIEIELSAVCQG